MFGSAPDMFHSVVSAWLMQKVNRVVEITVDMGPLWLPEKESEAACSAGIHTPPLFPFWEWFAGDRTGGISAWRGSREV